jgi:signal transduction histidine kinase
MARRGNESMVKPTANWRFGRQMAIALVAAVVLLLAGVGMSIWFEASYEAQKADEIGAQAHILAATVTAALTFNDRQAAQEYVNALRVNPDIEIAAIYDHGGALFAGYSAVPDEAPPQRAPPGGTRFKGGRLTIVSFVQQDNAILGTVYVHTAADPISRRAVRYAVIAMFVMMAVLVVLVLGLAHAALTRANAELAQRAADLTDANANLETQIREREKAEDALRQAQKMEAIGQLTGGVAHDFNNIMQVIIGNLEALNRRAMDKYTELGPLVSAAMRGAERAARLTHQLLAFARRQPLAPKAIEVNRLVAGMSDLLHRTLGETVQVETVLAGGTWRVLADANQLESALLNLALNARDAMPNGGKLTIETSNAYLDEDYAQNNDEVRPGQYVLIAVTDTGAGMSKDTLSKAFDPFFTTKEVGKGSGLGLSQVYGFMHQSGGHAKIYSEPGEGTTLKLYLPRPTESGESAEAAEAQPIPRAARSELVLVVEDDTDVRANTAQMVRDLGYDVLEAEDGNVGLRMIEAEPRIHLLFTDVGLPGGINGRQLADEAQRRRPELKILYSTGYARNAIVHHGRLDPGVNLITKPFTFAALAAKLRQVLDG